MRDFDKRDATREKIVALNRSCFNGPERAPDDIIRGIFKEGVVFTKHGRGVDTLHGAALVTTDDRRFNEPYIWMIGVHALYRGCGVASALLKEIAEFAELSNAKGVSLMVNSENVNAIRLYLTFGYRVKRVSSGYYGPNDGLYMRRTI